MLHGEFPACHVLENPYDFERAQWLRAARLDGLVAHSRIVNAGGDEGRHIKVRYPTKPILAWAKNSRLGVGGVKA
jgi:hypothetical protein